MLALGQDEDDDRPDQIITLPEFQVTAMARPDSYLTSEATTGTRVGGKIVESPYFVQVLTNEFIEDFQLFETDQQMSFIGTYSPGNPDRGVVAANRLRGFTPVILRDGFSRAGPSDFSNTDRVEVIRGPQSTLYGAAAPGGIINYVSKRPRTRPYYYFSATRGDKYAFERYDLEVSGPAIKDKLYYLVTGSYSYNEGDLEWFFHKVRIMGVTLSYRIAPRTTVTAYWEEQRRDQNRGEATEVRENTAPSGTLLLRTGGKVTGPWMPLIRFNRYGPDNRVYRNFSGGNLLLEHTFNEYLSMRVAGQKFEKNFGENRWTGTHFIPETGRFNAHDPFRLQQDIKADAAQVDLLLKFRTGGIGHQVLLAGDYYKEDFYYPQFRLPPAERAALPDSIRFLDPANPDYGDFDYINDLSFFHRNETRDIETLGATLSHRMYFRNESIITMAALRYNRVESVIEDDTRTVTVRPGLVVPYAAEGNETATTGTVGLNYKLRGDALVYFGNYSTSFEPTVVVDAGTGEVQQFERGRGIETGFKGTLLNGDAGYTVAFFQITKFNIPVRNPSFEGSDITPDEPQFIGQGEEFARGFDFAFSADVTRSLTLLGNFAYMNTELKKIPDAPQYEGDILDRAPRVSGSATVRYVFRDGPLNGLRVGVSGNYFDKILISRETDTRTRSTRDSYALYQAFAGYSWRSHNRRFNHSLTLNVQNLFDKFYLRNDNYIGPGREFRLRYTVRF